MSNVTKIMLAGILLGVLIITLLAYKSYETSYIETVEEAEIVEVNVDQTPTPTQINEPSQDGSYFDTSCNWDIDELYELCKIAMAEAEGEDVEGKALVMMVILNRVADNRFPNTIHGVIFANNQFTPVSDGRYDAVEPSDECWEALDMIMYDNWDKSQGALFFDSCTNQDNWHSRNLEYLFTHGKHRFYK